MSGWHRKGYGRVFVMREEDIPRVKAIVQALDEDEWECYAPRNLVGVFDPSNPTLVYLGKFETSVDAITGHCWAAGIPAWCYSTRENFVRLSTFPVPEAAL